MKKAVQARRQKNRALAETDHASRCLQCRRPLLRVRLEMGARFCDADCEEDYVAIKDRLAELKAKWTR